MGSTILTGSNPSRLSRNTSPHGSLVALSTMKDEGPYVIEWVAHHLALGFTDLLVYTNDCSDGTDAILKRLEEMDVGVHHRENIIKEGMKPHPSMLKASVSEELIINSDWLLVLDADEFMSINHPSGTLDGLLDDLMAIDAHAMVITWRIFGSSGIRTWTREPITEQFTWAAPPFWNKGWGTKTLLRFDRKYMRLGMHRPIIKAQHRESDYPETVLWVNGSGRPLEEWFKFRGWRSIRRTLGYDWAQMNHYAIKSMDAFSLRKYRGNANLKKDKYNSDYWALQDRNEVQDLSIQKHIPRRSEIMEILLADPELARLHDAAHARAEATLKGYHQQEAYQEYVAQLVEASKIPYTEVVAKPPKPRDPARIAAVQSKIEQRRNGLPKDQRRTPPPAGWGSVDGSPYVHGEIDLSRDIAMEEVDNQGIRLKVDPRIFTPMALDAVQAGKFERKHARKINTLITGRSCFLDLHSGIGFVGLKAHLGDPNLQVVNHDEVVGLSEYGRSLAEAQFPMSQGRVHFVTKALSDGTRTCPSYQALSDLIANFEPDVLRVAPKEITKEAFCDAVLQGIKMVIFPFMDPSQLDSIRDQFGSQLAMAGFVEDPDKIYTGSLCFNR